MIQRLYLSFKKDHIRVSKALKNIQKINRIDNAFIILTVA